MSVDPERIARLNEAPEPPERESVLYRAQMNRRERAFNSVRHVDNPGSLENLPGWRRKNMMDTGEYINEILRLEDHGSK